MQLNQGQGPALFQSAFIKEDIAEMEKDGELVLYLVVVIDAERHRAYGRMPYDGAGADIML